MAGGGGNRDLAFFSEFQGIINQVLDNVKDLHQELLKDKIILVTREGSIRVSVHLFNDESDIDKLIGVLEKFAKDK